MYPLLILHVAAGAVGLVSGFGALAFRKGSGPHRASGTLFVASMLLMGGVGAYIAVHLPQRGTIFVGLLSVYLVATAWVTVRRREMTTGPLFDYLALAWVLTCAAVMFGFGFWGSMSRNGMVDSVPGYAHFPFAIVATIAAWCDIRVIRRGGLSGDARIARHLWRMCTALLIAAFSFFIGQQKVMPDWMQGSPLLFAPPLAVLLLMVFWLIRLRLRRSRESRRPRDENRPQFQ